MESKYENLFDCKKRSGEGWGRLETLKGPGFAKLQAPRE